MGGIGLTAAAIGASISSAILLLAGAAVLIVIVWRTNFFEGKTKKIQRLGNTAILLLLAAAVITVLVILRSAPEVTLRFIGPPQPPILMVVRKNESRTTAKDMRYKVTIWNLDAFRGDRNWQSGLPPLCRFQRGELGGWLKGGEESGHEFVFETCPDFYKSLAKDDRLFGFAFITCADCAQSHGYWLYKVWGQPGWYAETADGSDPEIEFGKMVSKSRMLDIMADPERFFQGRHLLERKSMTGM